MRWRRSAVTCFNPTVRSRGYTRREICLSNWVQPMQAITLCWLQSWSVTEAAAAVAAAAAAPALAAAAVAKGGSAAAAPAICSEAGHSRRNRGSRSPREAATWQQQLLSLRLPCRRVALVNPFSCLRYPAEICLCMPLSSPVQPRALYGHFHEVSNLVL